MITNDYNDVFPPDVLELTRLPGIGKNTAGAIVAYAFNQPVTFIETNVRTVYIHHFFTEADEVSDKALQPLLDQTMEHVGEDTSRSPREWYWALMDYGTHIKQREGNASRKSKHYAKQSKFEGSKRQVRGEVLRQLGVAPQTFTQLQNQVADERLLGVLEDLAQEGIISFANEHYHLGIA
jgi:A/G-specific adenine glycosylase